MGPAVPEPFSYIRVVEDDDIDNLGHASNVAFIRWLQDVAIAHSESVGFGFDAYRKIGGIFVIRRTEIDYLRPALRGQTLELRTWLSSWMAAKYVRETEIKRTADGAMIARASVTWGYLDVASGRPVRVPDAIREAFGLPAVSVRRSTPPPAP
jgi:acyl-CoA thioester hydrolase